MCWTNAKTNDLVVAKKKHKKLASKPRGPVPLPNISCDMLAKGIILKQSESYFIFSNPVRSGYSATVFRICKQCLS